MGGTDAMQISANNQRVLVTAGAAGIGKAIATTFRDAGARVHICDVDQKALVEFKREAPDISASLVDVSDPTAVDRLFGEAHRTLGGLDVLVNNAGIAGPTAPVEDIAVADWDRTLAINISGMFYCTRLAAPLLKAAGGGAIINLSSVAGRLGFQLRTPYASSKWAVVGFTESLAIELGPHNIRVNAILPGVVEGDRINRVIDAKAKALGVSFEEMKTRMLATVSLRRMVSPQDIANMALYLASDAGRNVSGQALSVCAGVQALT
jgi:NAD(P)-dependent dehydrogenase (short-subunit alcohol dehydrogenase family)